MSAAPIPPTYTQDELKATCERNGFRWYRDDLVGGFCARRWVDRIAWPPDGYAPPSPHASMVTLRGMARPWVSGGPGGVTLAQPARRSSSPIHA
jgi:hypothetical protein